MATLRSSNSLFIDDNICGHPAWARELFMALMPLRERWAAQAILRIAEDPGLLRLVADLAGLAGTWGLDL